MLRNREGKAHPMSHRTCHISDAEFLTPSQILFPNPHPEWEFRFDFCSLVHSFIQSFIRVFLK